MTGPRRILITPTFRPHFGFNQDFLRSYDQHVADAASVPVHFVVSREELADLRALLAEFPRLDLQAHAVEDLLAQAGHAVDGPTLLEEVGKFAFQSLKKLYALRVLDHDQALILDSESLVLKPIRVGELFDEYFADPVVYWSGLEHRVDSWYGSLSDVVTANAGVLLDVPYPRMYLLEYYGWFYDKRHVDGLFAELGGDLLSAVRTKLGRQKAVFEMVLYYAYLAKDPHRHGYRFVSVNDLLREYLGQDGYARYLRNFSGPWEAVGIFEFLSKEVSEANLDALQRMFRDHRLRFYRCELLNGNQPAQDALLDGSDVVVLASSEHYKRMHQRVAVCLSGQARNYRQNLRHLRTFLSDGSADLFFHLWDSPDQEYIVRTLSPVSFVFEDQAEFLASDRFVDPAVVAVRCERFATESRDRGSACMFYSLQQANELKRRHERDHGFRYDVVVRLRLDLLSLDNLNDVLDRISAAQHGLADTLYVPDMAHSVGLNDQLAAGSSETMDAYCSAYACLETFAAKDYFNPEYFLLQHVLAQGLTVRTFPLQYVLLRDETVHLFDVAERVRDTLSTWWSAPLPSIGAGMLMDYFRAKARSVALVAELGLETPRLFRLRAPDGRLLTVEPGARRLRFAADEGDGSRFFMVVHADEDRTAVDLRCADLSLSPDGRGWSAVPDSAGALRPDGSPAARTAFFLGGTPEALTLEWRAGFWQSPAAGGSGRGGSGGRLFVGLDGDAPVLRPQAAGDVALRLEPVADRVAETAPIGMVAGVRNGEAKPGESRLVVLAWKLLEGARVYDEYGASEFLNRTAVLARRTLRTRDDARGGRVAAAADRVLAALQRRT